MITNRLLVPCDSASGVKMISVAALIGAPPFAVAAAPRRPAGGRHLHHHAAGALGAEPRRF
jgi:hypothetical protein